MSRITDPGNPSSFGSEFDYSVFLNTTELTLCNVSWDSEYRDAWGYESIDELDKYITSNGSPRTTIKRTSYARINAPVKIEMSHNRAIQYNYLRAANPVQPVPGGDVKRNFYYFIIGQRAISEGVTELVLQLDVWATYFDVIESVRGFLVNGHYGVANSKAMDNYGRDYLTVPEGFDTGSEYRNIAVRNNSVMTLNNLSVIVAYTADPRVTPYEQGEQGQGIKPVPVASSGGVFHGMASGLMYFVFPSLEALSNHLFVNRQFPWLTRCIVSIMLVPNIQRYFPGFVAPEYSEETHTYEGNGYLAPDGPPSINTYGLFANWRNSDEIRNAIPERYRRFAKFFTSPYMMIELTTFNATPIYIRPENWQSSNADVMERASLVPSSARIQFAPRYYGSYRDAANGETFPYDDGGTYWDMFTQISNLPTVPAINDQAALALASQYNSIAYSQSSADWTQQKALRSAATGYDNTQAGINNAMDTTNQSVQSSFRANKISNDLLRDQALVANMNSVIMGAGAGGLADGPGGAVGGAIAGAVKGVANNISTNMQIGANNDLAGNAGNTANAIATTNALYGGYVNDSNYDLQKYAARGDYTNTLEGIQAKVQDTQMMQPSVVGQMGGEVINLVNGLMGVSARWKMIDNAAITRTGEHWLQFGYAVNQYVSVPNNFAVMTHFSYWRMQNVRLIANIPEHHKQMLRGIIEKGVTVWKNPDDIGHIDIGVNNALSGVSLP